MFTLGDEDNKQVITFLYQLVRGMAARSYGLNVARLAGINQDIIQSAELLSSQLEEKVQKRRYVGMKILQQLNHFSSSFKYQITYVFVSLVHNDNAQNGNLCQGILTEGENTFYLKFFMMFYFSKYL